MNTGDRVKIVTDEDSFEGIIIPRPELLDETIIILKLDSGYNIGVKKDKIKSSEVIAPYVAPSKPASKLKQDPKLPSVAILSLGGTISSKVDYKTGGVSADYDANDFVEMCPELESIANISAKKLSQIMSEDADLPTISNVAKQLEPFLKDDSIDGIVLTSGTDCLHYITSALTFMVRPNKPVVVTAAQRSIDRGSSDAFMNLSCAVRAAASWKGSEVVVCMHEKSDDTSCILIRGNKVRKMHTSRRDAFRPINILPYARITYPDLELDTITEPFVQSGDLKILPNISDDVAYVHVHPGIKEDIIDFYIEKGYKGIMISGTALGHVPTSGKSNLLDALKRAIDAGIIVVVATQTLYGRTHPFVYANLRKLSVNLGCIYAEDMLSDTAYMKLAWCIANYNTSEEVIAAFKENLVGEINPILDEESFLY